jgi:predicted CXXCH cytochrome family protein
MMFLYLLLLAWSATRFSGTQTQAEPAVNAHHSDEQAAQTAQADKPQEGAIVQATRGVLGSKHDFSMLTGHPADACSACHVPHVQAVKPKPGEPEPFALSFYRMEGQTPVLVPDRYTPGPTSLICLSCHNGALAPSTVASSHAMLSAHRAGFDIDGFSTRDHPIGVEYPVRQKGYRPRAAVFNFGAISLPQNRMECVSCHDPHNAAGVEHMLVMSNRRSALCLSCHEK